MAKAADEPVPFRRGPFSELPERPRLPHPYGEAPKQEVVVESGAFGSVRTRVVTYGREMAPPLLVWERP